MCIPTYICIYIYIYIRSSDQMVGVFVVWHTRKNDKHIKKLKTRRESLLVKYSNRIKQLNRITNGKKEKHL